MVWTWWLDGEPLTARDLGLLQTAQSESLEVELWWSRGEPSAEPATDVLLQASTEDPVRPGLFLRAGLPPQDQLWWAARVVGHVGATSDFRTDWTPLGAYRALSIPVVEADTARRIELRCTPPGGAETHLYQTRLTPSADTHALPAPPSIHRGILSGIGDPTVWGLLEGAEVSVHGSDVVTVAPGLFLFAGRTATRLGGDLVLPDVDGNGETVAEGESYWAGLSQGLGQSVTVTSGPKGIEPSRPTLPFDEVFLVWIRAEKITGSILIEQEDLHGDPATLRHRIEAGTGLQVRVGPGRAIGPHTSRQWSRWDAVAVPPSTTAFLWQTSNGHWWAAEQRPEAGALGPWAAITADENTVTALEDLRSFADPPVIQRSSGAPPAVGQGFEPISVFQALDLETVHLSADLTAATTGALRFDVQVQGADGTWASLFPSASTLDLRPTLEAGTTGNARTFPEITALPAGSRLRFVTVELPDVPPERVELVVVARPPEGGPVVELGGETF